MLHHVLHVVVKLVVKAYGNNLPAIIVGKLTIKIFVGRALVFVLQERIVCYADSALFLECGEVQKLKLFSVFGKLQGVKPL